MRVLAIHAVTGGGGGPRKIILNLFFNPFYVTTISQLYYNFINFLIPMYIVYYLNIQY